MRFKEKLALTLRGYRMLHQLVPGAMLWAFVQNLVRALTPFLNVYLSGRIIDFLAQGRPLRDLLAGGDHGHGQCAAEADRAGLRPHGGLPD